MILISFIVISNRLLFSVFLVHYVNNYAKIHSTMPHILTPFWRGYYFSDINYVFLACSRPFYVYISIFILMSYCLLSRFFFVLCYCVLHLHNDYSIHFYVFVFFSFLLLLFFLLFKQIKRFLLNMQAIVSSPSHDFTLSQLHTVCVCTLCVSVCVLIQIRSPDICVSTWS